MDAYNQVPRRSSSGKTSPQRLRNNNNNGELHTAGELDPQYVSSLNLFEEDEVKLRARKQIDSEYVDKYRVPQRNDYAAHLDEEAVQSRRESGGLPAQFAWTLVDGGEGGDSDGEG